MRVLQGIVAGFVLIAPLSSGGALANGSRAVAYVAQDAAAASDRAVTLRARQITRENGAIHLRHLRMETGSVVLRADAADFDHRTRELRPRGNVAIGVSGAKLILRAQHVNASHDLTHLRDVEIDTGSLRIRARQADWNPRTRVLIPRGTVTVVMKKGVSPAL